MIQDSNLRNIIDAIPSAIFIINKDLQIFDVNRAASTIYNEDSKIILRKLCGEIFHCLHESASERECGMTKHCPDCVIRNSVGKAIDGKTIFKQKYKMKIQKGGKIDTVYMLISSAPWNHNGRTHAILTIDDISEIAELKNLLAICAKCKKIKRDEKFWENLESYFHKYTEITFSHSICPECSKKLYSELNSTKSDQS